MFAMIGCDVADLAAADGPLSGSPLVPPPAGDKISGTPVVSGETRHGSRRSHSMANVVLINPRFDPSFWGIEYALPVFGKKAASPVACLPLLAALPPPGHRVTLVDENVEPLDFDRLARADIVGLTGM